MEKRIVDIHKKNENKKSGKIKKRQRSVKERACKNQKEFTEPKRNQPNKYST